MTTLGAPIAPLVAQTDADETADLWLRRAALADRLAQVLSSKDGATLALYGDECRARARALAAKALEPKKAA